MIPLREIAAWRAHAPWPNDMQVEQDLLLTRAMGTIFADDFLRGQVVMRGGTVLHKVHLAPAARYSEDIDLVLVGDRPPDHVEKALNRVLHPLLGAPRTNMWAKVVLAVRNWTMPSEILRLEWFYRPTFSAQEEAKLKIEVNCTERTPFYDVVDLAFAPPVSETEKILLRSYDIDEMLGTKMRALLQREQGRDLFDLWWALHLSGQGQAQHAVDPDRVVAAFNHYMEREGSVVRRDQFRELLDQKLTLRKFRHDMDAMLRPGLPPYEIDAAKAAVDQMLVARLPI
jgi:predicted nucleotidyltransferase component of viral defense system